MGVPLLFGLAGASGRFDARALPMGEQGRQRLEILAGFRNGLLQAARDRRPERLDSLRTAGDAEFGPRLWLHPEERVLLLALAGQGAPLVAERELREALWGNQGDYSWLYFPELCPEQGSGRKIPVPNLGYAPDLIDHLHGWMAEDFENVMARLSPWPDLVEFLRLTRCTNEPSPWRDMDSLGRAFRARFPESPISRDIAAFLPGVPEWTGNGVYFGGGPSFGWHDDHTASLVSPGLQGGFFFAFHFPHLELGVDFQVRTFTALRAYTAADTVLPRGTETDFLRIAFTAGHSFPLGRNLYWTPCTGLLLSGLDWSAPEGVSEDRDFHPRALGWPLGMYVDWMFHPIETGNHQVSPGLGLRLSALYAYGRWSALEAGLGEQGFLVGLSVFLGWMGMEERK